jgi:AraC-like DNA-binding protein
MSRTFKTLYASPLVSVSDVLCTEGCGNGRHEEHCTVASIALVRHGTFVRRDSSGRHVADASRVFFFDPTQPYTVDHPMQGGDRCTALIFPAETLRETARQPRGEPNRLFDRSSIPGNADIHLAHRELLHAAAHSDSLRLEETAMRLLALCTEQARTTRLTRSTANRAAELAVEAQVLIARTFTERVTLEMLAQKLDVSAFQLCRAFRQATGGTLHQHLTRLRLASALQKLPQYRERLTALALDVGFSSHSHFTQAFRSYFGRAPSALLSHA